MATRLAAVEGELRKSEEAIERYLLAFESGSLPESACGERIQTLADKTADLRGRPLQLEADIDASQAGPTAEHLDQLRLKVASVITDGDTGAQKQLLHALVHEVRAASRSDIQPIFRIPKPQPASRPKGSEADRVGGPGRTRTTWGTLEPLPTGRILRIASTVPLRERGS